jgi:hypothetical protein
LGENSLICAVLLDEAQVEENFRRFKIPILHKEKEMADFRKWFLAFAVVALLFAIPASAQPALQCTANAGVPPTVRAEGLTELVGDIVLNCTGGTPTPAGVAIAPANVTVFLNVNVTSRLVADPMTEALLLIDEPHSTTNPTVPLIPCAAGTVGTCSVLGTSGGVGNPGPYGTGKGPNVFQGRLTGSNQVTFLGVPIDPPGSQTRVIRITNIRANANQLGVSSTLVPTQITAYISITGSTSVPVNNPQQTVAFVQAGLKTSIQSGTLSTPINFLYCNSANSNIAGNNTSSLQTGGQNGTQFIVRFDEGFASSWKVRNAALTIAGPTAAATGSIGDLNQNVPGAIYNTETGFSSGGSTDAIPTGSGVVQQPTPFPTTSGLSSAGVANAGTRLMIQFNAIPTGAQLFVPVQLNTVNQSSTSTVVGRAVLVAADSTGANIGGIGTGSFGPIPATSTSNTLSGVSVISTNTGIAPITVTAGTAIAVYEIVGTDPFQLERLEVPVAVAFTASQSGLTLGVQSTATASFAPISTVGTASSTAPVPRFAPGTPANSFIVNRCNCNILFPWVSNQAGFDTGIAISNTSADPFGTTTQTGTVTLNYYTAGTPVPPQTTNGPIPAGQTLAFTLSSGGNFGIAATPGFQGYIIAQSQFQYCHGIAFFSAVGAPGVGGATYLGIVLDSAGLNRTKSPGEVQAH